jgi:hypothetical protein
MALTALRDARTEVRACEVLAVVINSSAARQRQAYARADIIRALGHVVESGGHHDWSGTQAAQALAALFCNPSNSRAAAAAILAAAPGIVPSLCRLLVSLATPATYKMSSCASCVLLLWGLVSWDAGGDVAAQALQFQRLADALRRVAGASRAVCAGPSLNRPSAAPGRLSAGGTRSFCPDALMVYGRPRNAQLWRGSGSFTAGLPTFCCCRSFLSLTTSRLAQTRNQLQLRACLTNFVDKRGWELSTSPAR